jgi:hypothetical protein
MYQRRRIVPSSQPRSIGRLGTIVEQEESHLPLSILDLPRQGRLRDMEARGCSTECCSSATPTK